MLTIVLACIAVLALSTFAKAEPRPPLRESGFGQIAYKGHGPEWWHWQFVKTRRVLMARPTVLEAISLAAVAYRVPYSTLWRKARCETGGTFSPYSKNRHSTASGLFQFLTSTWASTPFAGFSIWDPYANALAAGWMHANGRGGEWVCQ